MRDGKQGTMMIGIFLQENPATQIQTKLKEIETGFKFWLSKQLKLLVVTATGAAEGAAIGGLLGTLSGATAVPPPPPGSALNPQALASLQAQALAGGALVQARDFAIITGVNAGISSVMKRIRGKEDVESR